MKYSEATYERAGGGEEAKPHSTKEGRVASGERRIKRLLAKWPKQPKKVPDPRHTPGPQKPIDPRAPYKKDRVMTPLRAKKGVGGRIGLKKGSVHTPGSHSWWLLQQSKPKRTKKAEGGRVNFRHGGSVGAAIKGHGAEIK